jgi:hypothetical protein
MNASHVVLLVQRIGKVGPVLKFRTSLRPMLRWTLPLCFQEDPFGQVGWTKARNEEVQAEDGEVPVMRAAIASAEAAQILKTIVSPLCRVTPYGAETGIFSPTEAEVR